MQARSGKRAGTYRAASLLGLCLAVGGCGLRDEGLGERCGDAMKEAFPGGGIKVTNTQVVQDTAAPTLTAMIARVQGVRPDLPAGGVFPRDVAVECRFEENVLTEFRWTAGPLQPSSGGH